MTLRKALALAATVPLLTAVGTGCKGERPRPAELARAEERLNLVSNPTLYLQTNVQESRDGSDVPADGSIAEKRLLSVTVRNTSHFVVTDIDGAILWLDESEHRLGATPFVLHDPLAPDQVRRFLVDGTSLRLTTPPSADVPSARPERGRDDDDTADAGTDARTLGARAASLQVVFDHVHVIE
jgi:hypothetical protein